MLNLHRLFFHNSADDCFLGQLTLAEINRSMLREARRKIREALRDGIYKATKVPTDEGAITPKFFTQGSWAYGTLNRATHVPPQQADMDDGCYLPISFLKGEKPKRSAQLFFGIADAILQALVKREGWIGHAVDRGCCCRVIIDSEHHVDVPLYAIRDEAYAELMKKASQRGYDSLTEAFAQDDVVDISWTILEREEVLLANRDGTWTPSDPREVKAWADAAFAVQGGEQLRRISRYLKGWRDQQYQHGGPSSILLMAIAEANFTPCNARDDLALAEVVEQLPSALLGDVTAPWDGEEQINRLTSQERQHAATLATQLSRNLRQALNGTQEQAPGHIDKLRAEFGRHFPVDAAHVTVATPAEAVTAFPAILTSTNAFPRSTKAG